MTRPCLNCHATGCVFCDGNGQATAAQALTYENWLNAFPPKPYHFEHVTAWKRWLVEQEQRRAIFPILQILSPMNTFKQPNGLYRSRPSDIMTKPYIAGHGESALAAEIDAAQKLKKRLAEMESVS